VNQTPAQSSAPTNAMITAVYRNRRVIVEIFFLARWLLIYLLSLRSVEDVTK
jgi:hypothetical protein